MAETWLRTNRRALVVGSLAACLLATLVGSAGIWWWRTRPLAKGPWLLVLAASTLFFLAAAMVYAARNPRIAFADGQLLIYLRGLRPLPLPLDVVEVFFLGQGSSHLAPSQLGKMETLNVIIRIAERAESFHRRSVWSSLGNWCDGYITVRGAWCEPLNAATVTRLNHQLVAARKAIRASPE